MWADKCCWRGGEVLLDGWGNCVVRIIIILFRVGAEWRADDWRVGVGWLL